MVDLNDHVIKGYELQQQIGSIGFGAVGEFYVSIELLSTTYAHNKLLPYAIKRLVK